MNYTEYEQQIFLKEQESLEKERTLILDFLSEPSPYERYCSIIDQVKILKGSNRTEEEEQLFTDLIKEGVEIERNLVKLESKDTNKRMNMRDRLEDINLKLSFVNSRLSQLSFKVRV